MKQEELEQLINRLEYSGPGSIIVGGHRFKEGEGERFASQIENNMNQYMSDEYKTDRDVIGEIISLFEDVDDDSWMYDDEVNEERNEVW